MIIVRPLVYLTAVAGLTLAIMEGCSSEPPPAGAPAAGKTFEPPPATTARDGASDADADAVVPPKPACTDLTSDAPVARLVRADGPTPAATGGVVVAGRYHCTEITDYSDPSSGGDEDGDGGIADASDGGEQWQRVTLRATATTLEIVSVQGRILDDGGTGEGRTDEKITYATGGDGGTSLVGATVCPGPNAPLELPYSVIGNELHVFIGRYERRVFTRIP